jgi:predicted site-specific integrase-resolvase
LCTEYVEAALSAPGHTLVVVDHDLVANVTENPTSLRTRRPGRRSAPNQARKAVSAADRHDH